MILILTCAYFSRWVGSIADYCMYLSYKKNVGSKIHPGRWTWFTWECTNQIINSLNFEFSMSGPRLPSPPPVPPVVPAAPASPSTESTKSSEKQCEVQISQRSLPVWGGHQTMQIYGIFGGISRFILFLHEVWVGNIKDYLFHEFLNTFQDATVIDFLSLKKHVPWNIYLCLFHPESCVSYLFFRWCGRNWWLFRVSSLESCSWDSILEGATNKNLKV